MTEFDFFPGYTPTTSMRSKHIRFWKPLKELIPGIKSKKVISNKLIISTFYASKFHQHELKKNLEIPEDATLFLDSGGFQLINEEKFTPSSNYAQMVMDYQIRMDCEIGAILDYPIDISSLSLPEKLRRMGINYQLIESTLRYIKNKEYSCKIYGVIHGWDVNSIKTFTKRISQKEQLDGFAYGTPKPEICMNMSSSSYFLKLCYNIWNIRKIIDDYPLHVFGISSSPAMYLMAYLGVTSFDSLSYLHAAKFRDYFLPWGSRANISRGQNKRKLRFLPCSCPICDYLFIDEMKNDGKIESAYVALHNLIVQTNIVNIIKSAIKEDWLGELVSDASKMFPEITEALYWLKKKNMVV